jgi:DNA repair protein RadC
MADKTQTSEPAMRWNPGSKARIRDLASFDRPREKLQTKGPSALSDVELLAVLLGSGTRRMSVLDLSAKILRTFDGHLDRATVEGLLAISGVGQARACQTVAAFELARRHLAKGRTVIREAEDVIPYLQSIRSKRQEHFVCLSLNGAHEVIESRVVTVGLLDTNQVHPREVFADPIADRAAAILVAHNHPSGTLKASPEDIALTTRLVRAGELLGIRVLDHVIVTENAFLSLKTSGHM